MTYNNDIYYEIRPYLHPNEEILWAGRPTSNSLSGKARFSALSSVFFIGFAIFWMAMASMAGGPFFLFGIPFLIVGVIQFYKTTFAQKNGLKTSIYVVTETRALIIVTQPRTGTNCKEYVFSNLPSVTLENVQNDIGTIRFEAVEMYQYEYRGFNRRHTTAYYPERELTTAFVMINDVHKVYHLISERLGR